MSEVGTKWREQAVKTAATSKILKSHEKHNKKVDSRVSAPINVELLSGLGQIHHPVTSYQLMAELVLCSLKFIIVMTITI